MVMTHNKARAEHADYFITPNGELSEENVQPPRWYVAEAPGLAGDFWPLRDGAMWRSEADTEAFWRLTRGKHPFDDRPLARNHSHHRRVAMHDFTFSPPKSVSVLWGLADEDTAGAIEAAHEAAVKAGLRVLSAAAYCRLGKGGVRKVPGQLVGALFSHPCSREADPQLHTHAVIMNMCQVNGQVSGQATAALEARGMLMHQGAVACVYAFELAHRMSRLGMTVVPTHEGHLFELAEVPAHVRNLFSQRQQQVQEELDRSRTRKRRGLHMSPPSRAQRQRAVLVSRREKVHLPLASLHAEWRARALSAGFVMDQLSSQDSHHEFNRTSPTKEEMRATVEQHIGRKFAGHPFVNGARLCVEACAALMGQCSAAQLLELLEDFGWSPQHAPTRLSKPPIRRAPQDVVEGPSLDGSMMTGGRLNQPKHIKS